MSVSLELDGYTPLTRSVDAKRKAYELAILDANLGRDEQRKIRRTLRLQREQPLPPTRPMEPVPANSPLLDTVVAAAPPASERVTRRRVTDVWSNPSSSIHPLTSKLRTRQ